MRGGIAIRLEAILHFDENLAVGVHKNSAERMIAPRLRAPRDIERAAQAR